MLPLDQEQQKLHSLRKPTPASPTEGFALRNNCAGRHLAASASSPWPWDSPLQFLSSNSRLMTNFLVLLLKVWVALLAQAWFVMLLPL